MALTAVYNNDSFASIRFFFLSNLKKKLKSLPAEQQDFFWTQKNLQKSLNNWAKIKIEALNP